MNPKSVLRTAAILLAAVAHVSPARASGPITEFPIPTAGSNPIGITAGPDGNLWFCEFGSRKIARSTPNGVITEFDVGKSPYDIVSGPDGNLWFTEPDFEFGTASAIGRISTTGTATEFPLSGHAPFQIAAGPDGNLWFTDNSNEVVGRISPGGTVTYFPLPAGHWAGDITVGPDGDLWLTELSTDRSTGLIGRMTTTGSLTEFPVPTGLGLGSIAAGPDGNLWFINFDSLEFDGLINRITTGGVVTEFELGAGSLGRGPGGDIWFTHSAIFISHLAIGADGIEADRSFTVPTENGGVNRISPGPDGNLWYTSASNTVGRLDVDFCPPDRLCFGNRFEISAAWAGGGSSGTGKPLSLTANAGAFWFFDPANVEVFVKILDNCRGSGKFNVYVNGLTHLGVTVTVTDRQTGTSKAFVHPDGTPFSLIFDGSTFACP